MSPTRRGPPRSGWVTLATVAKLRTNHGNPAGRGRGRSSRGVRNVLTLGALLALTAFLLSRGYAPEGPRAEASAGALSYRTYLPTGPSSQVIDHDHYSLGYEEDWEQARWVAHHLTAAQVRAKSVRRGDDFRADAAVLTGSAERDDYRGSGFTRGHLVPFGDLNYDAEAGRETFLYSNISPQLAEHNAAVWRELEDCVRDWAVRYGSLYIVTGPLVGKSPKRIGPNGVAVPDAFYKVLLTERGKGIGFVIPHARQTAPLEAFAKTIDEVEDIAGLDFFPELSQIATAEVENAIELSAWPVDEARYRRRVEQWNRQ